MKNPVRRTPNQQEQTGNNPQKTADRMLAEISRLGRTIEAAEAEAQAKIEQIRQFTVAELEPVRDRLKETEKALLKLMKAERKAIFDGKQKITLEYGILIHTRELKVSIPRDALKKIKALGWVSAIKVAESLDRGVVEKWPDERLFLIGAERKERPEWKWEVFREKGESGNANRAG